MSASSLEKTGSPKPIGIFLAHTKILAPTEFLSARTSLRYISRSFNIDSLGAKKGFLLTTSQFLNGMSISPNCLR